MESRECARSNFKIKNVIREMLLFISVYTIREGFVVDPKFCGISHGNEYNRDI